MNIPASTIATENPEFRSSKLLSSGPDVHTISVALHPCPAAIVAPTAVPGVPIFTFNAIASERRATLSPDRRGLVEIIWMLFRRSRAAQNDATPKVLDFRVARIAGPSGNSIPALSTAGLSSARRLHGPCGSTGQTRRDQHFTPRYFPSSEHRCRGLAAGNATRGQCLRPCAGPSGSSAVTRGNPRPSVDSRYEPGESALRRVINNA